MKFLQRIASQKGQSGGTAVVASIIGALVAVLVGVNLLDPVANATEDAQTVSGTDSQDDSLIDLILTVFVIGILLIPVKMML